MMRDLPLVVKIIINIVLYILYVHVISVIFSIIFPLVISVFWGTVPDPSLPENVELFNKIQYFILLLVLVVSLIWRKYFYIGLSKKESDVVVVQAKVKKTKDSSSVLDEDEDEDIKIYVDKEIK